jgi:hypothetical protein
MNKQQIEDMCRRGGLTPADKFSLYGVDVIVADGKVQAKDVDKFRRFGAEHSDFPWGCYATFWFAMKDDKQHALGRPLFFKLDHEKDLDERSKKDRRISAARKDADDHLRTAREQILNA